MFLYAVDKLMQVLTGHILTSYAVEKVMLSEYQRQASRS